MYSRYVLLGSMPSCLIVNDDLPFDGSQGQLIEIYSQWIQALHCPCSMRLLNAFTLTPESQCPR